MQSNFIPEPPPREAKQSWVKRAGAGAFTLSLLIHAVFIILAIFFFFKWVYPPQEPAPDFSGAGGGGGNQGQTANRVNTQMRRAMSATNNRRVAVSGETDFVLPDNPDSVVDAGLPSMDNLSSSGSGGGGGGGHGGGIGTGTGTGVGNGTGKGFRAGFDTSINPFGSKEIMANSLEGHLYDFKQNEKGEPAKYDIGNQEDFTSRVIELQKRDFRDTAFAHYFKAPDSLYISQIVIKPQPAETGPSFFGAADKVKPSGWLAHYHGVVKAPRDMTFRFAGSADDYLCVFSKSRPRLIATRPEIQGIMNGRWEPGKTDGEWPGPMGTLVFGDWIKLKKDETMPLDVCIAERPGSVVGFLILVEEKDANYQKEANGRPIIPIFTTQEVTPALQEQVTKDFPAWPFEWNNVPVFGGISKSDPFK